MTASNSMITQLGRSERERKILNAASRKLREIRLSKSAERRRPRRLKRRRLSYRSLKMGLARSLLAEESLRIAFSHRKQCKFMETIRGSI